MYGGGRFGLKIIVTLSRCAAVLVIISFFENVMQQY